MREGIWYAIVAVVVLIIVVVIAAFGIFAFEKDWKPKLKPWENPNGSYKEKKMDESIPTPTETPTLIQFGQGNGPLWCIPTWYSVRYVDQNGNYGKMGPWSTKPVMSSCKDSYLGCSSCGSTLPMISIPSANSKFSANVHRQSSVFHPSLEGEIVGAFYPASNGWIFIDSENPNSDSSSSCEECQNCGSSSVMCK